MTESTATQLYNAVKELEARAEYAKARKHEDPN